MSACRYAGVCALVQVLKLKKKTFGILVFHILCKHFAALQKWPLGPPRKDHPDHHPEIFVITDCNKKSSQVIAGGADMANKVGLVIGLTC